MSKEKQIVLESNRKSFIKKMFLLAGSFSFVSLLRGNTSKEVNSNKLLTDLSKVKTKEPITFQFPDNELAYLIDLGKPMEYGVGPNKSIVAYSGLCQHMGCPVTYEKELFTCSCHGSVFNPETNGEVTAGPALEGLPQIALEVKNDKIYATHIIQGVVYGRSCNTPISNTI